MKKIIFSILFSMAALLAFGQVASIFGNIRKPDGAVAPGVIIKLLDTEAQLVASSTSGNLFFEIY